MENTNIYKCESLAVAVTVFCEMVEIEMVPFHDKYQNQ